MGQTRLATVHPAAVKPVAVADQDALPVFYQLVEGFPGTVGIDAVEGHPLVDHGPEPLQRVFLEPGGLVDIVAAAFAGHPGDGVIGRPDRLRGPVDNLLDRSGGDGKAQYRVAKLLEVPAAHGLDAA